MYVIHCVELRDGIPIFARFPMSVEEKYFKTQ